MQLKISYMDGTRRIVNVPSEFFKNSEIKDRYKTIVVTPEQKAMDFALSTGARPYEILLLEGTEVVYRHTNKANKPIVKKEEPEEAWHSFMGGKGITEKEMKEAKKVPFTRRWIAGTEGLTWERGVNLLLNHIK